MTRRMERVNALLRQEISGMIAAELKDPRLSAVITVTRVDASRDLSTARVYVSVMGEPTGKGDTLRAMKSASGFIHRTLRDRLTLRTVPRVEFRIDESIEQGAEVIKLIDRVAPDAGAGGTA